MYDDFKHKLRNFVAYICKSYVYMNVIIQNYLSALYKQKSSGGIKQYTYKLFISARAFKRRLAKHFFRP